MFEYMSHDIQIYAHTHRPLEAKRFDKYIICPGSCGLPTTGDYKASFGILEVNKNKVEYKPYTIDYNVSEYLNSFANTGIVDDCKIWTKYYMKSVVSGKNYSVDFLLFARELMRKHNRRNKNLVDNDIWELADRLYNKIL